MNIEIKIPNFKVLIEMSESPAISLFEKVQLERKYKSSSVHFFKSITQKDWLHHKPSLRKKIPHAATGTSDRRCGRYKHDSQGLETSLATLSSVVLLSLLLLLLSTPFTLKQITFTSALFWRWNKIMYVK